jgi:hypothetical protein
VNDLPVRTHLGVQVSYGPDKGNRKLDKVSMQWSGLELWHYGNRNHDAEDGLCRDSLDEDNRLFRGIYSAYPADNIGIAKWGNL